MPRAELAGMDYGERCREAAPDEPHLTVTEMRELVRRALRHESEALRERAQAALEDALGAPSGAVPHLEWDDESCKWFPLAPDTTRVPLEEAAAVLLTAPCRSMIAKIRTCWRSHYGPGGGADRDAWRAARAACPVCREDARARSRVWELVVAEYENPTPPEVLAAELPAEPQPEPPADGRPGLWRHCQQCGARYWARTRRSAYCRAACRQAAYEARRDAGL